MVNEINRLINVALSCLFILVITNKTKAQDEQSFRLTSKPIGVIYQKNRSQKGNEFLFDKWNKGEIILSDGQKVNNIELNFNAYSNDLLYAIKGNTAVVVSKIQYKGFKIYTENRRRNFALISDSIFNNSLQEPIILEVLHEGKIKAYADRKFRINYNLMKNNPFGQSVYYSEDSYYVIIEGELISSPRTIRSYYKFYNKSSIKQIIKSNDLNLKVEEELLSFLAILDTWVVERQL